MSHQLFCHTAPLSINYSHHHSPEHRHNVSPVPVYDRSRIGISALRDMPFPLSTHHFQQNLAVQQQKKRHHSLYYLTHLRVVYPHNYHQHRRGIPHSNHMFPHNHHHHRHFHSESSSGYKLQCRHHSYTLSHCNMYHMYPHIHQTRSPCPRNLVCR